jgi:hypothetical protein
LEKLLPTFSPSRCSTWNTEQRRIQETGEDRSTSTLALIPMSRELSGKKRQDGLNSTALPGGGGMKQWQPVA